jgi:hypothetical protein
MVAACGGGEMSLTEYAERLTASMNRAMQQWEVLVASPQGAVFAAEGAAKFTDFTPQDLQAGLERMGEIQDDLWEAAAATEPPEEVTDLHNLLFDARSTSAREALATRAGTAATWEELSESPEMATWRTSVAAEKQACIGIQADLDATAERGIFAEVAWIPGDLKKVIEAALGCATWSENPEDLYRPPPTSTP